MDIQPLIEGQCFHIYNRGVNGGNIFIEKKNYYFFLDRYKYYCSDALETLAYCLLKNHFHFLVFVKENIEVPRKDGKEGMFRINASKQLGHLFNSYAQAINKAYDRTGPLFESPFERKLVTDEKYITTLIRYCHRNPVHHRFVGDLKDWEFSSYHSILNNDNSIVNTEKAIIRFGSISGFEEAHNTPNISIVEEDAQEYIIERSAATQTGSLTPVRVN